LAKGGKIRRRGGFYLAAFVCGLGLLDMASLNGPLGNLALLALLRRIKAPEPAGSGLCGDDSEPNLRPLQGAGRDSFLPGLGLDRIDGDRAFSKKVSQEDFGGMKSESGHDALLYGLYNVVSW
jgi:hypothetical protein